jgi:hypothetical protein
MILRYALLVSAAVAILTLANPANAKCPPWNTNCAVQQGTALGNNLNQGMTSSQSDDPSTWGNQNPRVNQNRVKQQTNSAYGNGSGGCPTLGAPYDRNGVSFPYSACTDAGYSNCRSCPAWCDTSGRCSGH